MKSTMSQATARRWMVHAGYKFGSWKKDVYVDVHERQGFVEYQKVFWSTWLSLSERMASLGEAMDILESPNDVSQEQDVWVIHDESIFYDYDDGEMFGRIRPTQISPKRDVGAQLWCLTFFAHVMASGVQSRKRWKNPLRYLLDHMFTGPVALLGLANMQLLCEKQWFKVS
ncbi:hypothetical protein DYB25_012517 [Aphanomyces astaci]|uniref:Uncharacterized protein n=1 Tax=Aphanomyces astaci TaxID=112090 RepID=A0A397F0F9_APHAT|nr:hypothetical protein DYB25_012517 [Aphanomyces astaci]RHY80703.1 hypothetical protein DYB26_006725 [Aphanomyces astaci]RHZ06842.1 hypothetical protein DYB31_007413 [Aphanomyces astaci]